jgi:hypothetical protein
MLCVAVSVIVALMLSPSPSFATPPPDGRVYELVSPTQKSGGIGGVFPLGSLTRSELENEPLQSSSDGSAIVYVGEDFYQARFGRIDQYLSKRGPAGWSTANLTPGSEGEAATYFGLSPDLSAGVVGDRTPLSEDAPVGYPDLYLTRGAGFQSLLMTGPPNRLPKTFGYAWMLGPGQPEVDHNNMLFAGGNAGTPAVATFSHLLLEANDALTPDSKGGGEYENNLYEWSEGQLWLVNVLPDGQTEPNASFGVNYSDRYHLTPFPNLDQVISDDGSKIFWTDENNHNLYVRENAIRPPNCAVPADACTELVSEGGEYWTASGDGSRVFFTKNEHLYVYVVAAGVTEELASGGVLGMIGASNDGTYAYFVSTGALTGGAIAGPPHLYLSHAGQLSLIATLSLADDETSLGIYGSGEPQGDWYRTFAGRTAEVSPSGRYVAFMAEENLTRYETLDANGRHDFEAYVYDAATGQLACASCNTDGTPPTSSTLLPAPVNGLYQQRYLNDNGQLFFSTPDPVVPEDTNGASDVYEYEQGHVHLISPGETADEAVFADASESGNDVFFTTRQQLVPADRDRIVDLYDARVHGRTEEGSPPPPCAGEACLESPSGQPAFQAPASAVFVGAGDLAPPAPDLVPPAPKPAPRPLTRAQKLARALRACHARRGRRRRSTCEALARKRYR